MTISLSTVVRRRLAAGRPAVHQRRQPKTTSEEHVACPGCAVGLYVRLASGRRVHDIAGEQRPCTSPP